MNRKCRLAAVVLVLAASAAAADASQFARNANFVILVDDRSLADEVLASAEVYRREIALEWLGEELPPGIGAAMINVKISDAEESALTWARDRDSNRKFHRVWLTTSRDRASGEVLKHEIAHVVLATQFTARIAPWIEEGIASRYDDRGRVDLRQRTIAWYAKTGNWPNLQHVLYDTAILADDVTSYALAGSVCDFLIARHDKQTLLRFAQHANGAGWNAALKKFYAINDVEQLQSEWQTWVLRRR